MNNIFSILAPAKLNLNLFVKGKANNGMHLLESDICCLIIVSFISSEIVSIFEGSTSTIAFNTLADKVCFRFSDQDSFHQNNINKSFIIDSKNNLVLETLNAFRIFTGWNKKFKIYLDKNIPIGAGLGGGSADAAATLIILRKLFNKENKLNKISLSNIYKIGLKLGSDIPACLESKSLKLSGYGDKVKRNKIANDYFYLLVKPNIKLSTEQVFEHFSLFSNYEVIKSNVFLENINIHNSLQSSAIVLAPQINSILLKLKQIPNIVAYGMTGSGSTCFGIFNDLNNISTFLKKNKNKFFIWYGKKRDYSMNRVRVSKTLENRF